MEETPYVDDCLWNIFDDTARVVMGIGLFIAGTFSVFMNVWLLLTFVKGCLMADRSHFMVLILCVASLSRNVLAGFPFTGTSAIARSWMFGRTGCSVFAFLNQFIGVYQIEALNHMCIERYVVAKYVKFGWAMTAKHYVLMLALCWLFSIVYTVPTVAGFGRYSCDLSGTACTLDFVWEQDAWRMWYNIVFVIMAGVKPAFMMCYMLWHARQIEKEYYTVEHHGEQLTLTQTVVNVTLGTLICWLPQSFLATWLVTSQLIFGVAAQPPLLLVFFAAVSSELATGIPVIIYLLTNPTIQTAMLSLWMKPDVLQKIK